MHYSVEVWWQQQAPISQEVWSGLGIHHVWTKASNLIQHYLNAAADQVTKKRAQICNSDETKLKVFSRSNSEEKNRSSGADEFRDVVHPEKGSPQG